MFAHHLGLLLTALSHPLILARSSITVATKSINSTCQALDSPAQCIDRARLPELTENSCVDRRQGRNCLQSVALDQVRDVLMGRGLASCQRGTHLILLIGPQGAEERLQNGLELPPLKSMKPLPIWTCEVGSDSAVAGRIRSVIAVEFGLFRKVCPRAGVVAIRRRRQTEPACAGYGGHFVLGGVCEIGYIAAGGTEGYLIRRWVVYGGDGNCGARKVTLYMQIVIGTPVERRE